MKNIIEEHFNQSSLTINSLKKHEKKILKIVNLIVDCKKKKKKILVAGNGGSCADAEHFTGELICTFSAKNRDPISAISLSNHPSAITAWSNDFGFDTFYKRQIDSNGEKGDLLVLLSTGGGNKKKNTSMNLVYAAELAKKKGLKVISLIGKSGGILKKISHINIHVQSFNTAYIQEAHMSVLHCICVCLDKLLLKKNNEKKKY
jgi:D-sedoheptulose 7-phosphate isomerase